MGSALLALLLGVAAAPLERSGLDEILARQALAGSKLGVAVIDVASGELLYGRAEDRALIPASNQKLLTSAAAITLLGPEHVFVTRFLADGPAAEGGVLAGDLVIRGSGDPCLHADALAPEGISDPMDVLAGLLVEAGVTRVGGRLVLDDSAFDRQFVHPDWEAADLDQAFAAPVAGLTLDRNCLQIVVDGRTGGSRPRAEFQTASQGYTLRNELAWSDARGRFTVGLTRPDPLGVLRVHGLVGRGVLGAPIEVPVLDPLAHFGQALLAQLQRRGIRIEGGLALQPPAQLPRHELARFETPLDRAVFLANKESDNSAAEHLFKAVGALAGGQGSFESGARGVAAYLASEVGPEPPGQVLRDGSGLSRGNRVAPRRIAGTLAAMHRAGGASADLFLRSLPVSGWDGTLDQRLGEPAYRGAVRAKTGYIRAVSALSGLAFTRSGRALAFSVMINDYAPRWSNSDMKAIQDDVCRELVDHW